MYVCVYVHACMCAHMGGRYSQILRYFIWRDVSLLYVFRPPLKKLPSGEKKKKLFYSKYMVLQTFWNFLHVS